MNASSNRRRFFQTSTCLAAGAALSGAGISAQAIQPIKRPFGKLFKLSCAAYSYRKYLQGDPKNNVPATWQFEDFLDECAKMGLGAAEPTSYYFPVPVTDEYLINFKRNAFMLGLDISGTAIGNTFTYPKGPQRDEQLNGCRAWIDRAALLGAPCIRIFAGNLPRGESFENAMKWCVETTKEACDYAGEKGVFLALENHGGIVAKAEDLVRIVNEVESDWFGVNFDSGNFHTDDPYADLKKIAPYAVNAQVKVEMKPANEKVEDTDFARVFDILAEADYRGYVALEYEAAEEPKEAIPRYIDTLQTLLDKM